MASQQALLRQRGNAVVLTPRTALRNVLVTAPGPANATASYGVLNTGVIQLNGSGGVSGEWLLFGSAADYEVRFTHVSGTVPSGVTYATWLGLGTSRVASLVANRSGSVGVTTVSGVITVEIRRVVGGTIVGSANMTITAEAELF